MRLFSRAFASPLGRLVAVTDGESLKGLWFQGQKYFMAGYEGLSVEAGPGPEIFSRLGAWLEGYFAGERPLASSLPLAPEGGDFRREVWRLLGEIPYGETSTYGDIARGYEALTGKKTSPRAVGGAVGRNPISIIVPCHRVLGAGGALTGYAGGVERKRRLLELEGFRMPEREVEKGTGRA